MFCQITKYPERSATAATEFLLNIRSQHSDESNLVQSVSYSSRALLCVRLRLSLLHTAIILAGEWNNPTEYLVCRQTLMKLGACRSSTHGCPTIHTLLWFNT